MDALLAELQAARLHMSVNYQDRFKTKAGGERHRGWTSGQIGPKQSKRNAPAQQDAMQTHEITLS